MEVFVSPGSCRSTVIVPCMRADNSFEVDGLFDVGFGVFEVLLEFVIEFLGNFSVPAACVVCRSDVV